MNTQLLIPAAGMGRRLGARGPKALIRLGGREMLIETLRRFQTLGLEVNAIVVAPDAYRQLFEDALREAYPVQRIRVATGGSERQASVANGLDALDPATEVVVIHDAARPFVDPASVRASIAAARDCGAATVAVPCADTILEADSQDFLAGTPDRQRLWACQTPQTFRVEVIREAHRRAREDGFQGTDDASLVRRYGGRVQLVLGTSMNFKVTTREDLALAEMIVQEGLH